MACKRGAGARARRAFVLPSLRKRVCMARSLSALDGADEQKGVVLEMWPAISALELVMDALDMALACRRPWHVVHHSDHRCQYTSIAFGLRCREASVQPSIGSAGDAYDNALCENVFATLECELQDRRRL